MDREESKFYSLTTDSTEPQKPRSSLYKLLSTFTSDWATLLSEQQKNITSLLYGVYKYECINVISLSEVVKKVHMERNEYLEYKFKIQRLK